MDINIILSESSNGLTADGMITLGLGIITLFISLVTIRITKKQFADDKRISIKPYFNCEIEPIDTDSNFKEAINKTQTFKWSHRITLKKKESNSKLNAYPFKLILNNIGLGHAIDCEILGIKGNITENSNKNKFLGVIQVNTEIALVINLGYFIESKYQGFVNTYFNTIEAFEVEKEKVANESLEKIYIDLKYTDVLGNIYIKTICLGFEIKLNHIVSFNYTEGITGALCNSVSKEFKVLKEEGIERLITNSKSKSIMKKYTKKR